MGFTLLTPSTPNSFRAAWRPPWPAIVWVGLLFLVHVQTWWTMFGLRRNATWTFGAFLVVLLQPAVLYLMSALALPEFAGTAPVDLRENYFAHSRWFFGLAMVLLLVSITKDFVIAGSFPSPLDLGVHLVFLTLWGVAVVTRRDWYHRLLAPSTAALFAAYVILLFTRLS